MKYQVKRFSSIYRVIPQEYLQSLKLIEDKEIRKHSIQGKDGFRDIPGILWPVPQDQLQDIDLGDKIGVVTIYFQEVQPGESLGYSSSTNSWILLNKKLKVGGGVIEDLPRYFLQRSVMLKEQADLKQLTGGPDDLIISKWLSFYYSLVEKYL